MTDKRGGGKGSVRLPVSGDRRIPVRLPVLLDRRSYAWCNHRI